LALTWKIQQLGPLQNGEFSACREAYANPGGIAAMIVPFQ
jgi:hypothetical protein